MNTKKLIDWYHQNKRDLPWRNTKEPYIVWLSEIILQQTRVAQGLPYFQKFIAQYPTIHDLAQAGEQEVLKLWQGLGYYSRARNLHYTARDIVKNYNGKFPSTYKELLRLKGVGEYTAAAIASFCYNEPVPVIDGNVYRVLSRLKGIETPVNTSEGKKIFKETALKSIDKKHPADYNQAIMEFGALQCVPANPSCKSCPLQDECVAYQTGKVNELPVKLPRVKVKKREMHYFIVRYNDQIILQKRQGKDIWKNLYELPLIEIEEKRKLNDADFKKLYQQFDIEPAKPPRFLQKIRHKLTHRDLEIHFWEVISQKPPNQSISIHELKIYPMPVVIAKFLDNYNL